MVMPVIMDVTFSDGETQRMTLPVQIWGAPTSGVSPSRPATAPSPASPSTPTASTPIPTATTTSGKPSQRTIPSNHLSPENDQGPPCRAALSLAKWTILDLNQ